MFKFLQNCIKEHDRSHLVIQNTHGLIIASIFKNKCGDLIMNVGQEYSLLGENGELESLDVNDPETIAKAKSRLKLS